MATDLGKVGIVMKGTWSNSAPYETLDAVSYNSGLYIAKQNVPANTVPTNTDYWQCAIDNDAVVNVGTNTIDVWKAEGVTTAYGGLVKVGRMHILSGRWAGSLTGNTAVILTIPSQYRPSATFYGNTMIYRSDNSQWSAGSCTINSDGTLKDITTSAAKTSGTFNIAWYV